MTRAEKIIEARRLRTAESLPYREIAERLGVSVSTVGEYFVDPDLSRHRKRRYARGAVCVECGAPVEWNHVKPSTRCVTCDRKASIKRNQERARRHREAIESLWADGRTRREIAAIVGSAPNISSLRRRGYNLPYRRTPEQIVRIVAGSDERMAKARAARRAARAAA